MRILLVEDNAALADGLVQLLAGAGHAVDHVADGAGAEALIVAERFDLVVLDLNLPQMDGLEVLRGMRTRRDPAAVMILTARGTPEDRVRGLDLGADDYMVKPFEITEFEARVRSLLRRQAGLRAAEVRVGGVLLDLTARRFSADGQALDLPAREHALLELLFMRAGKVVAKDVIMQSMTSLDEALSDNAIEQYASRLRRRLAPHGVHLRTARGIGYYIDKGV
ncbi:Transcriptional regulator [Paracoccus nototheniae]|uniref:response regulator n=1 Tax=Paracoccus nototheniae TaxID=2489002 RepID=UPI00103DF623|nr:response regulator transcription factor [Paracoccus nototheniae]